MSTLKVGTIQNADGTRTKYTASAWVNFNGTGTVAIRDSGNISSITDHGAGAYTASFTVAMANANYATSYSGQYAGGAFGVEQYYSSNTGAAYSTSAVSIVCWNNSGTGVDPERVFIVTYGGDA